MTTRTIAIRDGHCDVYPGGFRDFVEAGRKAKEKPAEKPTGKKAAAAPPVDDRAARRAAFEVEKAGARAVERKKKRIAELEDLISSAEAKVEALREELKGDPGGNWEKIANLAREEQALSRRLESMMSEWSTLNEQLGNDSVGPAAGGDGRT